MPGRPRRLRRQLGDRIVHGEHERRLDDVPATTTTTTAKLLAGTYTNDQLAVTKVPAGFNSGSVIVNGFVLSATKDTSKVLFVSGTTSTDSPKGSAVRYGAFTPAYDKNGITCRDQNTNCTITNSTVQGVGPTNSIAQNGIEVFGAGQAVVSGNTVSGNSYAGGGAGNSASGILILNAGTVSVDNNHVSTSDENIYAGEVPQFGLVAAPVGQWTIDGNTVSGATFRAHPPVPTDTAWACSSTVRATRSLLGQYRHDQRPGGPAVDRRQ